MSHTLVVGMTESGKSTLLKIITSGLKKKGVKVAVLDPLRDPEWEADYQTDNPAEFLEFAKANKQYVLVVDESGEAIGRYNAAMHWLATTARHFGHSTYFLMQGVTQIDPIIRTNCNQCFLFASHSTIIESLAKSYDCDEIRGQKLKQGDFFIIGQFVETRRGRVDFASRAVTIGSLGELPESEPIPEKESENERPTDDHDESDNVDADSGDGSGV